MKRTTILVLFVLASTGCVDLGLEGNTPEAEAAMAPPTELVAAVTATADGGALIVDGRPWLPAGHATTMGLGELVPVGSAMGATVYARAWDDRPYDELFTRVETEPPPLGPEAQEWQRHLPVLGGVGAGQGAGTEHAEASADADAP